MKYKLLSLILALTLLFSMVGCGDSQQSLLHAVDLMDGVKSRPGELKIDLTQSSPAVTDFGLRLFQNAMEAGENTLISPLSILSALSMTANGADGETLTQMETVLGMTTAQLNPFLKGYMEQLEDQEASPLSLANSIWIKDDPDLTIEGDFLQANADYYNASVYKAAFDRATCDDINNWIREHTNGMIEHVLDEIPENAVTYLVNALAFEGQWRDPYQEAQVRDGTFTTQEGQAQPAELMYSSESVYLEDEQATGFMKSYQNGYAFVALLPREGISVEDYISGLTGEKLYSTLSHPQHAAVTAAVPKFQAECDYEMSEVLMSMGMTDAFDWTKADFSRLGSYENRNIVISRILHKTFISVTELGTEAGAATVVEAPAEAAAMEAETEIKEVILDRPFVYMLVDQKTNTPFFMGAMMRLA